MDLSNYFWQRGMRKEDIQYLATPHPYKWLRVCSNKMSSISKHKSNAGRFIGAKHPLN